MALYLGNDRVAGNIDLTAVYDAVYPVGRGFIDFTNTDYSNYLGFTWERELVGMTAVGLDTTQTEFNTVGKTGGEKTHKLTNPEMPSHTHKVRYTGGGANGNYGGMPGTNVDANPNYNVLILEKEGGDQPHNNLPPYKVVAYWKRVA